MTKHVVKLLRAGMKRYLATEMHDRLYPDNRRSVVRDWVPLRQEAF